MLYTEIPNQRPVTPLLDAIDHPLQLRKLAANQLATVADELRQFILYAAGQSAGHFGANLGVIELTVQKSQRIFKYQTTFTVLLQHKTVNAI